MTESKILPIADPPIKSFPFHANHLAITATVEESASWFYSNYLQLASYDISLGGKVRPWFDFYTIDMYNRYNYSPWLKNNITKIHNEFLLKHTNIVDFIMDSINSDYYAAILLDDYYISQHPSYKLEHQLHEYLIYGYDLQEQCFHIGATLKNYNYTFSKLPCSELTQAFEGAKSQPVITISTLNITLLKVEKKLNEYNFNLKVVIDLLEDYLLSRDTSEKFSQLETTTMFKANYFGLETYNYLTEYLRGLVFKLQRSSKPVILDVRALYIIWEHKKVMLERIAFINNLKITKDLSSYYEQYQEIVKESQTLLYAGLRFRIANDAELLKRIIANIDKIVQMEKPILQSLLVDLKQ